MKEKNLYQITNWCHHLMSLQIEEGDICVDATAGNGNDTEYLCRLVGEDGKVYAFDIQEQALERTKERLEKNNLSAELVLAGHEKMADYVQEKGEVSCIVFNFGYLPGGDHNLATKAETSIVAIQSALELLKVGGALCLCIYSGGDSGYGERDAILSFLKELDSKKYLVITMEYYNRPNDPPMPVLVKKL